MTGRLTLGAVISVATLTVVSFAMGGWRHLHRQDKDAGVLDARIGGRAAAKIILYDAGVPIDFILSLRGANPDKRFVVLPRAKAAIRKGLKKSEQIERRIQQVREAIAQQGIQYVVASDPPNHSAANGLVPVLRWDPRFQLVGSYPVTIQGEAGIRNVYLYENRAAGEDE